MNRDRRAALAQETLAILETGRYQAPSGHTVEIGEALRTSVEASRLYRPEDFPETVEVPDGARRSSPTAVEVTPETTLQAARRLAGPAEPLCLNFASAKNPGGGFLSGSQAQEESLARSSALYASLIRHMAMYEHNRRLDTCLYSSHMIHSPGVPVFRDDDGRLLEEPYRVAFLTAPAVNAGAVRRNEPESVDRIRPALARRLERLLWVALSHGHENLVLGAWGCGVFDNDPEMIAGLFAEALGPGGPFDRCFDRIMYAVYDRTPGQAVLSAFRAALEDR